MWVDLKNIEENIIKEITNEEKGNKTAVARRLGITRITLWRKLNSRQGTGMPMPWYFIHLGLKDLKLSLS